MANIVGKWEGGYVHETSAGKRVYYIRKRIGGRLYDLSTHATTLKAALAHYERFLTNAERYDPSGALAGKPLTVKAHLDEYVAYCKAKGNSANWVYQKRRYLNWWARAFPGDIRTATREKLLSLSSGKPVPHNRTAALKAFCSWLRDVKGSLPKGEDPTVDLAIPALKPAQWTAPRAISREVFAKTLEHVGDESYRDILTVLAGTGMHTTECLRLAKGSGSIVGTALTIFHKSGQQHRMEVEPHIAEAVARVQKRGGFSISRLMAAVREACKAAEVEGWAPGGLRHSVATWLISEGASINDVASYLNHDAATLKRFYSIAVIPKPRAA